MEPVKMECSDSIRGNWGDVDIDILVKIFQSFSLLELTSGLARVCSTWRLAACDPILWKTLDLTKMKANYIKVPYHPWVYVDRPSDKALTRILKLALSLSHGNTITLSFHYELFPTDEQLRYCYEKCPRLKRLVLPSWNRFRKESMCKAINSWRDLESMTMPNIGDSTCVLKALTKSCNKFSELKFMGTCDKLFASCLVSHLPNLKVLSLRCSKLLNEDLITILDGLKNLEVLNISHCLLMETPPRPAPQRVIRELDENLLKKASGLRKFITCMNESCIMCQRTKSDDGILRWRRYEEGLWKVDEIKSLSL